MDALKFDPWFTPADVGKIEVRRMSREELQPRVPYMLATGPGEELKLEMHEVDWISTRITYQLKNGDLYRVVQDPVGTTEYRTKTPPEAKYHELSLYGRDRSDNLAPWSEVNWDDPRLGEIEIASESMPMRKLIDIAKEIIDMRRDS